MPVADRETLEAELRALHASGELRAGATRAIEAYGPEILGFLVNTLRARQDAADVFSQFCEDLWRGLPTFRWQSSLRTWAYTLARNAAFRFRDDPHARRRAGLSDHPEIYDVAERVRTTTLTYLKSDARDRVADLRDSLETEDQMLLVLRIDREMSWTDVARILLGGEGPSAAELTKKAAAARKRFERIKELLRARMADTAATTATTATTARR